MNTQAEVIEGLSIQQQNENLKEDLLNRGFYVNEVNRGGGIEYLIVSTAPPDLMVTSHTAN